ncbi:MAG: cell division protein SepF [Angustibacter sp.]
MAGALRKTMVYLGLAEDDRYDHEGYDDFDEDLDGAGDESPRPRAVSRAEITRPDRAPVTPLPQRPLMGLPSPTGLQRITTIHPRTYNDAKTIGESFRDGVPVIMNLTDMGDPDAKRLVDFAAGLVFALHGTIERVTAKVFLLSPAHVEVTADDKESADAAGGPFNQS